MSVWIVSLEYLEEPNEISAILTTAARSQRVRPAESRKRGLRSILKAQEGPIDRGGDNALLLPVFSSGISVQCILVIYRQEHR